MVGVRVGVAVVGMGLVWITVRGGIVVMAVVPSTGAVRVVEMAVSKQPLNRQEG